MAKAKKFYQEHKERPVWLVIGLGKRRIEIKIKEYNKEYKLKHKSASF